jgi:hypothetical protein
MVTGTTAPVSLTSGGVEVHGKTRESEPDHAGRRSVRSTAGDLGLGDTKGVQDVFHPESVPVRPPCNDHHRGTKLPARRAAITMRSEIDEVEPPFDRPSPWPCDVSLRRQAR